MTLIHRARLVGTLILVLVGVGSAVIAGHTIGNVGVSIAFGSVLMVLIYALGPVSGCHINPAVSLGMLLLGRLPAKDTFFYIAAQMIGATVGAYLVYHIASGKIDHTVITNLAANGFGEHSSEKYSMMAVALTETLMTVLLLTVIFSAIIDGFSLGFAGLAIGFTLIVIHLFSLPISNTSVNFARSFGSAIIQQGWALEQLWVFGVAQLIAVPLAVVLHRIIFCDNLR